MKDKRGRSIAGRYRNRVTIQKPATAASSENDFGEIDLSSGDTNWSTYAERWAQVIPASGREFVSGEQVQADVTHMVHLRHDSLTENIIPDYRVKYGTRYLNIVSAYARGQHQTEMVLQCQEVR